MEAMRLATTIGMLITEFWEITPFELSLAVKGYSKRQEQRQKESMYQAYLISRWVWAKKIDIKKYLGEDKPKRRMTDEEMLEKAKVLNALLGGTVVKR
jgi:predicted Co/Zn/Cd cation transporter (cation efflux family)